MQLSGFLCFWFWATVLCVHGRRIQDGPDPVLNSLPTELTRLEADGPIEGVLTTGARKFGISVVEQSGGFPDILVSLEVINAGAKVGIRCGPFNASSPDHTYRWESQDNQGTNYVFISTHSPYYKTAITDPDTKTAEFLCSIERRSAETPSYRVEFDATYAARTLVMKEQNALKSIYEECCAEPDTCIGWKDLQHSVELEEKEARREVIDFDVCHVHPNVCDEEGHLIKLNLDRHGLRCPFPVAEFSQFTRLQKISTVGNQISGNFYDIANSLKGMKNLTEILLSYNLIDGELVQSGTTDISNNPLCVLASRELRHLDLKNNKIKGPLPPCLLSKESQIRDLILTKNPIGGPIPDTIAKNSRLEVIAMDSTLLKGPFPESFVHSKHLVSIDLSNNALEGGLPNHFGPARKMRVLDLGYNRLTGKIPDGIAASETLETVNLNHNLFDSLPDQWLDHGPVTPLINLDISHNLIDEDFPVALTLLPWLSKLYINSNRFTGPLPTLPEMFPNLWIFNASTNDFRGTLPREWTELGMFSGTATPLKISAPLFDLSHNSLSGRVPPFFFDINNLPRQFLVGGAINMAGNSFDCPVYGTSNHLRGFEECSVDNGLPIFGDSVFVIDTPSVVNSNQPVPSGADTSEDAHAVILSDGNTNPIEVEGRENSENMTLWIVVSIVVVTLLISIALGFILRVRMIRLARAAMAKPEDVEIRPRPPTEEVTPSTKHIENTRLRVGAMSSDAPPL